VDLNIKAERPMQGVYLKVHIKGGKRIDGGGGGKHRNGSQVQNNVL
jgi:hypothetical protein